MINRIITEARTFAIKAHGEQKRKYINEYYVNHPFRVLDNLIKYVPYNEITIAMCIAALLHDTIEDTDTTLEKIENLFGEEVASIVDGLTDKATEEMGNRDFRKEYDKNRIMKEGKEVQTIKCADIIDNLPSIIEHDPEFAIVYVKEKKALLDILTKANTNIRNKAYEIVRGYYAKQ